MLLPIYEVNEVLCVKKPFTDETGMIFIHKDDVLVIKESVTNFNYYKVDLYCNKRKKLFCENLQIRVDFNSIYLIDENPFHYINPS
jgi:hypothetical protein